MESRAGTLKQILVASKNKGKIAEIKKTLAELPVVVKPVSEYFTGSEPDETGDTFRENAILKATYYYQQTQLPCLADDSGLEVDIIQGQPGVKSARYAGENANDQENNRKLLQELQKVPLEQRTARFRCVLAYVEDSQTVITAEGSCEGMILTAPQGSGGFGYDPLFYLPGLERSLAELSLEEKNRISHRGQAMARMAELLRERLK